MGNWEWRLEKAEIKSRMYVVDASTVVHQRGAGAIIQPLANFVTTIPAPWSATKGLTYFCLFLFCLFVSDLLPATEPYRKKKKKKKKTPFL